AHFSHDTPRNSVVDLPVACFPRAREPGSTPSNRRAPQVCRKAPKIDRGRPPAVDLSVAPLARLALGVGHRQARNGRSLASCRLSFVLDLEGALRKTRTTRHVKRGPRSDSQDVPGESRLGCTAHPRRTAQTGHRHRAELGIDIGQSSVSKYMVRCRKPPSQTWRTFLENHAQQLVSIDFFTVPTIRFQVLYVFLVLAHDRRRILHFNVTTHPTADWTGQQLREAFPFAQLPRYLLRDRDAIFGDDFREHVRDLGICEVLSAPRSPWQRAYIERVIGSVRRECLDHM